MPEWTRAMWPAANRPARVIRHLSWLGLLAVAAIPLLVVTPVLAVVMLAISLAADLALIALGVVALRRSATQGGRGLAIWALSVPPVFALGTAAGLVAALLLLTDFR